MRNRPRDVPPGAVPEHVARVKLNPSTFGSHLFENTKHVTILMSSMYIQSMEIIFHGHTLSNGDNPAYAHSKPHS